MDQRVQNTRTALQAGMRELLGQVAWDTITIKMLCENASISRTTFYANFQSKEDLLDSLLCEFEKAMRSVNNGRSLTVTGTFTFLPLLLNHVNGNRQLFAKSNTSAEGFPVADRFKRMIDRLTCAEMQAAYGVSNVTPSSVYFIAGGIYHALVHWSCTSAEATHLKFLAELDAVVQNQLAATQTKQSDR